MKKIFASLLVACMAIYNAMGQTAEPTVFYHNTDTETEGGEDVTMNPGESNSAPAPLELTLTANLKDDVGWTANCEWKITRTKDGEEEVIIDRFEEDTKYTLTQSGSYSITLYVTFTNSDGKTADYESEAFTVAISESKLSCPDGFSPNGDEINDKFKITFQSIIKMEGAIFNRWGQKLHTFNLSNAAEGWDGRFNGDYVKDGTYFLNLQAVGSDGVKYNIKKAITVLKSWKEYEN